MKALCWRGVRKLRVEFVPDPVRLNSRDAIVRVRLSGISEHDLHHYQGQPPTLVTGEVLGREFCGELVEKGSDVRRFELRQRVVVPAALTASGDAEYVAVPMADSSLQSIPDNVTDEQALLTTDALPSGMLAVDLCDLHPGDVVAVWGAGPVGQCALLTAVQRGASRVIVIDPVAGRLEIARHHTQAETLRADQADQLDVVRVLRDMTHGVGPDVCIDAVDHEMSSVGGHWLRKLRYRFQRPSRASVLDQAIAACRVGGTVSVVNTQPGAGRFAHMEMARKKGLTLRFGQPEGTKYTGEALRTVARGEVDPSYIITHRFPLARAAHAFALLEQKSDDCLKVLLSPS